MNFRSYIPSAQFELGQIVATASVAERMESDQAFRYFVEISLKRFVKCDWGLICDDDKTAMDNAVTNGSMLMGSYRSNGIEIWIITEWDRSVTTVLFPHER